MKGLVLDIEHFAVHDGPGIRMVVFLKGCPLRCMWCHTPESQSGREELLYFQERCLHCGRCGNIFENLAARSTEIGTAEHCPVHALQSAGKWMDTNEIIAELLKEKIFFDESGGGLTISGGEPLFQAEFTTELLLAAHEKKISCCIETCGCGSYSHLKRWLPMTGCFLYDFKVSDPALHRKLIGTDNGLILENLHRLSDDGAEIVLRCPLIPGINDSDGHLHNIAATAEKLAGIREVHIIPYHPMARGKYMQTGRDYSALPDSFPTEATVSHYVKTVSSGTAKKVIVP